MSQLILYWNIGSQPARAIKTLINIGKIPCEFVTIDMLLREQRNKPYLDMYPAGKVPIIKDGDFVLGESGAIMIYLCEKHPTIAKYYGQTVQQKATVNQYVYWYQNYFRLALIKPLRMYLGAFFAQKPINQTHKNTLWKRMYEAIQRLDQILLKNGTKYITGEFPTIADFLFFYEITNLKYFGQDHQKYSQVKRWFTDVYSIKQVRDITQEWYPTSNQLYQLYLGVNAIKPNL